MHLRFTIGTVPEEHRQAIQDEEAAHGSFLHIPLKVF
jgi:galactosylxylosylprotein 3-beta-galactosyltransferase